MNRATADRRARYLLRWLPHPDRPAGQRSRRRQVLSPLHERRRLDPNTMDLTPGATEGVRFDGMTADGSKVFFSSEEHLIGEDENTAAPISTCGKKAILSPSSPRAIKQAFRRTRQHRLLRPRFQYRSPPLEYRRLEKSTCGVLAIGGGGGVLPPTAPSTSSPPSSSTEPPTASRAPPTFISPAPAQPPRFVATLESSANASLPSSEHPFRRSFGSFVEPAAVAHQRRPRRSRRLLRVRFRDESEGRTQQVRLLRPPDRSFRAAKVHVYSANCNSE